MPILDKLGPYAKTVAAVIIGSLGWATMVVHSASGPITADEWLAGATVLATAVGVYTFSNTPPA
jgi:hypothetical protein